ncbi:6427_t:CDS:2 [Dentiscutata heterogama]|uniref:6427_t:CDS:1 n=1 Tax=Dentiscutata heterogama TaxID=1316150 RepID=A0ACA9KIR8_9GLOM|nr:6427_t:CDS:2 [Dentiscutata heterogama]
MQKKEHKASTHHQKSAEIRHVDGTYKDEYHYEEGNRVEVEKKVEVDLQMPVKVVHTSENNKIEVKRNNYKAENEESAENKRLKRFTDNDALNHACEIWIKKRTIT